MSDAIDTKDIEEVADIIGVQASTVIPPEPVAYMPPKPKPPKPAKEPVSQAESPVARYYADLKAKGTIDAKNRKKVGELKGNTVTVWDKTGKSMGRFNALDAYRRFVA
jgi:hypothetical protein